MLPVMTGKPGRPPKKPVERRRPIEVGMSPRERETVSQAAEYEGVSLSAFIRRAALKAAQAVVGAA